MKSLDQHAGGEARAQAVEVAADEEMGVGVDRLVGLGGRGLGALALLLGRGRGRRRRREGLERRPGARVVGIVLQHPLVHGDRLDGLVGAQQRISQLDVGIHEARQL